MFKKICVKNFPNTKRERIPKNIKGIKGRGILPFLFLIKRNNPYKDPQNEEKVKIKIISPGLKNKPIIKIVLTSPKPNPSPLVRK